MSDLIILGILFATYAAMHTHTAGWTKAGGAVQPAKHAWQSAFLLTSSLTCGFVSLALKHGQGRRLLIEWLILFSLLLLTIMAGGTFWIMVDLATRMH